MRKVFYQYVVLPVICMLLHVPAQSFAAQPPPDGWRYPDGSDFAGGWLEFRDEIPEPFHVRADFNGDGLEDDAWILIREDGGGWGLFAVLGVDDGQNEIIRLLDEPTRTYTNMGMELVQPGVYKTACGKGYWDCAPGEPEEVEIIRPGINLFMYEGASTYYYWDDKDGKFKAVAISD